jgi:hypothetical protein
VRAHIFVVDKDTFPVHRDRGFCGIGPERSEFHAYSEVIQAMLGRSTSGYRGMLVDILGTRPGDVAFFYERKVGFHGVYKITDQPFFDSTIIHGIDEPEGQLVQSSICFRVPIQCQHYFPKPVPEDMLFATPEREATFWVWFYRKIQIRGARGCTAINPEAAQALLELLVKLNGTDSSIPPTKPYSSSTRNQLDIPLGKGPAAPYEDLLRGWLIQNIDNPNRSDIREIIGPDAELEWFANNVPYHVAGRNIDILIFHSTNRYLGTPIRYKYSVVELKRYRAVIRDIEQLIGYSRWVAGRLAQGEAKMIQPILIANGFQEKAIARARSSDWNILLVKYKVENNSVTLYPASLGM